MSSSNKRRGNPIERVQKHHKINNEITTSPNASPNAFRRPQVMLRKFYDENHSLKGIIFIFVNHADFTSWLYKFPVVLNDGTNSIFNGKNE
jgi:hypothetical protein